MLCFVRCAKRTSVFIVSPGSQTTTTYLVMGLTMGTTRSIGDPRAYETDDVLESNANPLLTQCDHRGLLLCRTQQAVPVAQLLLVMPGYLIPMHHFPV